MKNVVPVPGLNGDRIEFIIREEPPPDHGRRVMILHHSLGRATQMLDDRGHWVYSASAAGFTIPPNELYSPERVERRLRVWLALIRRDTPVGKIIWDWVRDALTSYSAIVHPSAVPSLVQLQTMVEQLKAAGVPKPTEEERHLLWKTVTEALSKDA